MRDFGDSNLATLFNDRTRFVVPVVALSYPGSENTGLRVFSTEAFFDNTQKTMPTIPGTEGSDEINASRETALLLDLSFATESMRHIPRVSGVEDLEQSASFTLPNKPVLEGLFGTLEDELVTWYSSPYPNGATGGGLLGKTRCRVMLLALDPQVVNDQELPYIEMSPSGDESTLWSDLTVAEIDTSDEFLKIGATNEPVYSAWPVVPSTGFPPDVGLRLPILFGKTKKTRCVIAEAPASSTLAFPLPISVGASGSILLADASNFSDPAQNVGATVSLGGESISYAEKVGNQLIGLTRNNPRNHLAGEICTQVPESGGSIVVASQGEVDIESLFVRTVAGDLMRVSLLDFNVETGGQPSLPDAGTVTVATFTSAGWMRTVESAVAAEIVNAPTLVETGDEALSRGDWRPAYGNDTGDWTISGIVNPYEISGVTGKWQGGTGVITFTTETSSPLDFYGLIKTTFLENETLFSGDIEGSSDPGHEWQRGANFQTNDLQSHEPFAVKFVFHLDVTLCQGPDGSPIDAEVGFFAKNFPTAQGLRDGEPLCIASFDTPGRYRVESRVFEIVSQTFDPLFPAGSPSEIHIVQGGLPSGSKLAFSISRLPYTSGGANQSDIDNKRPTRFEFSSSERFEYETKSHTYSQTYNPNDLDQKWWKLPVPTSGNNNKWSCYPTVQDSIRPSIGVDEVWASTLTSVEISISMGSSNISAGKFTLNWGLVPGSAGSVLTGPYMGDPNADPGERGLLSTHSTLLTAGGMTLADFRNPGKFLSCEGDTGVVSMNSGSSGYPSVTFTFTQDYYENSVPSGTKYEAQEGSIIANPGSLSMEFYADCSGRKAPAGSTDYRASSGELLSYSTDAIKGWLADPGSVDITEYAHFDSDSMNPWTGSSAAVPPWHYEAAFDARLLGAGWADVLVRLAYETRTNITRGYHGSEFFGFASGGKGPAMQIDHESDFDFLIPSWFGPEDPIIIEAREYISFEIIERSRAETFNSVELSYQYRASMSGTEDAFSSTVSDSWDGAGDTYVSRSREEMGIRTFKDVSYSLEDPAAAQDWANYMCRELCRPRKIARVLMSSRIALELMVADICSVEIPASGFDPITDNPSVSGYFFSRVTQWERTDGGIAVEFTEIPDQGWT